MSLAHLGIPNCSCVNLRKPFELPLLPMVRKHMTIRVTQTWRMQRFQVERLQAQRFQLAVVAVMVIWGQKFRDLLHLRTCDGWCPEMLLVMTCSSFPKMREAARKLSLAWQGHGIGSTQMLRIRSCLWACHPCARPLRMTNPRRRRAAKVDKARAFAL